MRHRTARAGGLTLADICIVLAMAAMLLVYLAPFVACRAREQANRVKCASNLRQIGQGIQMYANENKGNFPRALYDGATAGDPTEYTRWQAPDPFGPGGPGPNDVTAALFLLLRTQDLTPEVFVCPTSQGERWDFAGKTAQQVSNWPGGRYLTYSYMNPYPTPAVEAGRRFLGMQSFQEFAIAADVNPGDTGVTAVTPQSTRKQMATANSTNHNGDGQNVLYGDGHVEYQNTPFCGITRLVPGGPSPGYRDNIYTYGNGSGPGATGVGVKGPAADRYDTILLPVGIFGHDAAHAPVGGPTASHFVALGGAIVFGVVVVVATLLRRRAPSSGNP